MLESIMRLFEAPDSGQRAAALAQHEQRLAAAALLVHAAQVDGEYSEAERQRLTSLLEEHFSLGRLELAELLGTAEIEEREAVDLYRFTSVLARHLDQPGRQAIVEMLWEVAMADGTVHEFEDNLVWRVAELLGVSARDRIRLRKEVAARQER